MDSAACSSQSFATFKGSSSYQDPDVVELSSSSAWTPCRSKRKRAKVIPHDIIEINEDDDPDAVILIGETNPHDKDKQPVAYSAAKQMQKQIALSHGFTGPSTSYGPSYDSTFDFLDFALSPLETFNHPFSCNDYENGFADLVKNIHNYNYKDNYNNGFSTSFADSNLPPRVEVALPPMQKPTAKRSIESKQKVVRDDEVDIKFKSFKHFDTVRDHSDHHFSLEGKGSRTISNAPKNWAKKVQNDWKVLEKDLPDTIYVRVYEDRMDLLRAVIVGPDGTPYHDGLFFFDVLFPPSYPQSPPQVHYHSGGLRLNPNLYACGKVCLSLLNTWNGHGCEKWNPSKSTMLQVLVSIQALVLNAKPYFNEPGYEAYANTPTGEKSSLAYNEQTFLLSCKTMLYSLKKPPKHFEDFVAGHFRHRAHAILVACRAYMDGAQVGCLVGDGVQDVDEGDKSSSEGFKSSLRKIYDDLVEKLTPNEATDNSIDTRLKL